ncbi:MAG: hypothetical protein MZW92_40345 [Comamonadaceae bacterium]|nr:hypothetical protein [Comamonadaceae bacterium]
MPTRRELLTSSSLALFGSLMAGRGGRRLPSPSPPEPGCARPGQAGHG